MTGQQLWTIFTGARVPNAELLALGEAVGYKKEDAPGLAQAALLKIAMHAAKIAGGKIVFSPSALYQALKHWMPGLSEREDLLRALGNEYAASRTWALLNPVVRAYLDNVGNLLPTIVTLPSIKPPTGTVSKPTPQVRPASQPSQPPKGLTSLEWTKLRSILNLLAKTPSKVSDNDLAAARNLASRGKLATTMAKLDVEIERRGTGAQTEDASTRKASKGVADGKEKKPLWPFVLGIVAFVGGLSIVSRRGHRAVGARLGHAH